MLEFKVVHVKFPFKIYDGVDYLIKVALSGQNIYLLFKLVVQEGYTMCIFGLENFFYFSGSSLFGIQTV